MNSASILVVDPDAGFRGFTSSLLRRVGYHTVEKPNGESAMAAVRNAPPALVLLEIELPGVSGYQVCRELRDEFGEELPIVFVSGSRTGSLDRVAGLHIGADDYLVKPVAPEELIARVRRLLARTSHHVPQAARTANAYALSLSRREREVLRLLAEGLTNKSIGQVLFISPKTVATHVQRILTKLGVRSRAEAVAFAYQHHLIETDQPLAAAVSSHN